MDTTTIISDFIQVAANATSQVVCKVSNDEKMVAYIANLLASCLSIIGSSAIIINYIFFLPDTKRQQPLYKLILFLSIADFFGSLSICISQSVLLSRASINFFFVASFMWMSSLAFHTYWSSRQRSQVPLWVFQVVSWGVPTVMTAVMVGRDMITEDAESGWCQPNKVARWAFWFGPLLFSLAWNIILYAMILWQYRSSMSGSITTQFRKKNNNGYDDDPYSINQPTSPSNRFITEKKRKLHLKVAKRLGVYLLAFLICWVPDVFDNLLVQPNQYCQFYWLWLLQNITSPLQGFLNFIVYGVHSEFFFACVKSTEPQDIRSVYENKRQESKYLLGK
ncbi:G-protein-coupled receptor family protein [Cavenderia fasciculata]|uniref:G-protein-coupled receptor family protein n=1 Tax=Cavenderia fasciculata TaxID=261658 RepID=F4QF09_CACFS|nr:G-protein-coupled receptor family protein [Cavenderia fasciculata]EGG13368.1 G-protein-coupled receptor family protein [Cavenderia fasciculata]|eukprot:XP_004350072.1 G-protein-coupled receptor family protein [Cavenderia fasciculata]